MHLTRNLDEQSVLPRKVDLRNGPQERSRQTEPHQKGRKKTRGIHRYRRPKGNPSGVASGGVACKPVTLGISPHGFRKRAALQFQDTTQDLSRHATDVKPATSM